MNVEYTNRVSTDGALSLLSDPQNISMGNVEISVKFDAVPVTSELLTITRRSRVNSDFNTTIETYDPSSKRDPIFLFTQELTLLPGDCIEISYANTDGRTIAAEIQLGR